MRSSRFLAVLVSVGLAVALAPYLGVKSLRDARQESAVAQYAEQIFRSPTSHVAGNPQGDVSVVAFFDYNCPYCRKDAPALSDLMTTDPNVRMVLKELPVLGADSEVAARVALAAQAQGKYYELYARLVGERGRATREKALRIASALGLDTERLERDAQSPAVSAALKENEILADRLGVRGVPFYLVGDRVLSAEDGFPERLTQAVAELRETGCRAQC